MKRRIAFLAMLVVLVGFMLQNRTQAPVVLATPVTSTSNGAPTEATPDVMPVSTVAATIAPTLEPSATPIPATEVVATDEPFPTPTYVVPPRPTSPPPAPTLQFVQPAAPLPLPVPAQPVPNQVVITFNSNATAQERQTYIEQIGGTVSADLAGLNSVVVNVAAEVAEQPLPESAAVAVSEPDYYAVALGGEVNDPLYDQQWALPAIGAPAAWVSLSSPTSVLVAVIDSGICADHPDLQGRILPGYDFVQGDSTPQDEFGHGCAVSGVIAANSNNALGIAGVAPNAQILPLRVLNAQGVGTYSNVAAAIVFAADNGARIINLSLGGSSPSTVLESAVNYAASKGVTVVAAAGNTGGSVLYPAAYAPVIAVASVDQNLQRSSFSSYGAEIDLLAPGRDILTTRNDGGYALFTGTSFAAPYAAGAAAVEFARGQQLHLGSLIDLAHPLTEVTATPNVPISTSEPSPTSTLGTVLIDFNTVVSVPDEFRESVQSLVQTTSASPGWSSTPPTSSPRSSPARRACSRPAPMPRVRPRSRAARAARRASPTGCCAGCATTPR